ncbi:putative fimbrial operon positive regulatory protein FanR [Escherichia coli]|uniref:AraC family transcriptional regulator n=1 Tax=Escherichia coli TaxID=562 RepID=UPI000BE1A230|nr:AraC family transcriptional regulator [Escherichia coli]CAD5644527.1 putative fimbrial operon positive regulatory protein FanR [Escherichia coli]CAD5881753.1 putative fimbrial operon positive regulatory protein FanR [Escherichia coli]CAD6120891.1 putative fimbrial operon positive regulatory protein FanR [Escherichia coli]
MNTYSFLNGVDGLSIPLNIQQTHATNKIKLNNSLLMYIKQSGMEIVINEKHSVYPEKNSILYLAKGDIVSIDHNKKNKLPYETYFFTMQEIKMIYNILYSSNEKPLAGLVNTSGTGVIYLTAREDDLAIFKKLNSDIHLRKKIYIALYLLSGVEHTTLLEIMSKSVISTFSESVRALIEENISKTWRINDVCKRFHLSESSIRKKLSLENKSFNALVMEVKMCRAAKLILATEKDIGFIARSVGYTSPSYFIKSFKNHFNITPKQFSLKSKQHY